MFRLQEINQIIKHWNFGKYSSRRILIGLVVMEFLVLHHARVLDFQWIILYGRNQEDGFFWLFSVNKTIFPLALMHMMLTFKTEREISY